MKKIVFLLLSVLFLTSCEDPNIDTSGKKPEELLTANIWQLEKFTNPQGSTINEASLNSGAKLLYGLAFDFRKNNQVLGIDKSSKDIINRGTWKLLSDGKTIDIDIIALESEFEIIRIGNKTLTLSAKTEDHIMGLGPEVHLVFKEYSF